LAQGFLDWLFINYNSRAACVPAQPYEAEIPAKAKY
jgi:hypothetical protein